MKTLVINLSDTVSIMRLIYGRDEIVTVVQSAAFSEGETSILHLATSAS